MWLVRFKTTYYIGFIKIFSFSSKHDFIAYTKFKLNEFIITSLNYVV